MADPLSGAESVSFGPFTLLPHRRLLMRDGKRVRLGSRALEILVALTERPGELVTKEELFTRAWPTTYVEISNLKVAVSAIRKALEDESQTPRYVATVNGRGYRFIGLEANPAHAVAPSAMNRLPPPQLPQPHTRLVGRDFEVSSILANLTSARLLTVLGPGGIGKTRVAIAVAEALRERFPDTIHFVELASIHDPDLVVDRILSSMGLTGQGEPTLDALCRYVADQQTLMLVDNCEHLIEPAAMICETLLSRCPGLSILTTSREPLGIPGERLHWLAGMGLPPEQAAPSVDLLATYPAVQLFVERATDSLGSFVLEAVLAPVVVEICRRLDGNPLALELAAARLPAFNVHDILAMLKDRFVLLSSGKRGSHERQHSLLATLEWSYRLLSAQQQVLLERLSIFVGHFTLQSAIGVAAFGALEERDVRLGLSELVSRCMISCETGLQAPFRLLETTREFAHSLLVDRVEAAVCAQRLLDHVHTELSAAAQHLASSDLQAWLAANQHMLADFRSCLAWASSPDGDPDEHVRVAVVALPLLVRLSRIEECRRMVETIFSRPATRRRISLDARMKLFTAWGGSHLYTRGPTKDVARLAGKALCIAELLDDQPYAMRCLWGLSFHALYGGSHEQALNYLSLLARKAEAEHDLPMIRDAQRCEAAVQHYMGYHQRAEVMLEHLVSAETNSESDTRLARFQLDHLSGAYCTLAHISYVTGRPDTAVRYIRSAVQQARSLNHAISIGNVLALGAVPIALYRGDYDLAGRLVLQLENHIRDHGLLIWRSLAETNAAALRVLEQKPNAADSLQMAIHALRAGGTGVRTCIYEGILAEGLTREHRHDEAFSVLDASIASATARKEVWCMSELLRQRGNICRAAGGDGHVEAAEADYVEALSIATRQGAHAWGLRTVTSLAELWFATGQEQKARLLLSPYLSNLKEGFSTRDMKSVLVLRRKARVPDRLTA